MTRHDDARAALKLARQKVTRCRRAISDGRLADALFELEQLRLNVEDADGVLETDLPQETPRG